MYSFLTVLIAALPVVELRGAVLLAVLGWHMGPFQAVLLSILGNFLVVIPLLLFWERAAHRVVTWHPLIHRAFHWLFERTRRKHGKKFETASMFALFLFVAIPLPLTGAWTGTVAAYLFGVPFWKAVFAIGFGIIAAGILVGTGVGLFV